MVDLPITKWIKKKIRRLIAIVEDTDVATHSIASGKYVVWKGDLCKATAPIAVGGALSLSNLSPVSDGGLNELSEQIGTLNSNLASKKTVSGNTDSFGFIALGLPLSVRLVSVYATHSNDGYIAIPFNKSNAWYAAIMYYSTDNSPLRYANHAVSVKVYYYE